MKVKCHYYCHEKYVIIDVESHTYAPLKTTHSTTNHPHEYEAPMERSKTLTKCGKNKVPEEKGVSNILFHQYDVKGHSDPSEHVYAVLEQGQEVPKVANDYDEPPREDMDTSANSLPSDHMYAVLEKPIYVNKTDMNIKLVGDYVA